MIQEGATGDTTAATPIDQVSFRRRPTASSQLFQHVIPLPADPLSERRIITGEVRFVLPIVGGACRVLQKCRTHSFQRTPVNFLPVHRVWCSNESKACCSIPK